MATSGLIVHPDFRGLGLAKRIKQASFQLARLRWPKAKIFSLTSGAAVMKMNTELGYVPVTFNELTDDEAFWKGCEGCINHDIPGSEKPQVLHLHSHAVRSDRAAEHQKRTRKK